MIYQLATFNQATCLRQRATKDDEMRKSYSDKTIIVHDNREQIKAYGRSAEILGECTGTRVETEHNVKYLELRSDKTCIIYPRCIRQGYKIVIIEE